MFIYDSLFAYSDLPQSAPSHHLTIRIRNHPFCYGSTYDLLSDVLICLPSFLLEGKYTHCLPEHLQYLKQQTIVIK